MFIALEENNKRISIENAQRKGIYTCPICKSNVIAKKGEVNKHHFAHINKNDCDSWSEMSEWHKEWQDKFKEEYREIVLENHRADIKKDNWIIEFQKSPLSEQDMKERIDFYTKYGNLIFLFDLRDKDIWDTEKKSIYETRYYLWNHYSKSIVDPSYSDKYYLFFQIEEDLILWVKGKGINYKTNENSWKCIEVYKKLTKDQFIKYFTEFERYKEIILKKHNQLERKLINDDFNESFNLEKIKLETELINKYIDIEKDKIEKEAREKAKEIFNVEVYKINTIKEIKAEYENKIKCEESKLQKLKSKHEEILINVELKENIIKNLEDKYKELESKEKQISFNIDFYDMNNIYI